MTASTRTGTSFIDGRYIFGSGSGQGRGAPRQRSGRSTGTGGVSEALSSVQYQEGYEDASSAGSRTPTRESAFGLQFALGE